MFLLWIIVFSGGLLFYLWISVLYVDWYFSGGLVFSLWISVSLVDWCFFRWISILDVDYFLWELIFYRSHISSFHIAFVLFVVI